jgi:hypothetical protein
MMLVLCFFFRYNYQNVFFLLFYEIDRAILQTHSSEMQKYCHKPEYQYLMYNLHAQKPQKENPPFIRVFFEMTFITLYSYTEFTIKNIFYSFNLMQIRDHGTE